MTRRLIVLLLLAGALSLGGGAALAYWTAGVAAGGAGAGAAASVNATTTPTVSKYAAQAVQVTWPAVTLSNSVAVDGYVVTRYNSATLATQTVLAGCTGTINALTCTETGVPTGSWKYSVHPVIGTNWAGAESGLSATIATAPGTLSLTQVLFKGPFPASTTGTIAGFGVNEAVTYKLDAATTLTGFPAVVDVTGGAPISSLSIPSAAEGPHTVTVTGANGSTASTTITIDTVAPIASAALSPTPNGGGWNLTTPVTVTLSAIDGTSGVSTIRYTTDGTDPTVSGTAITYSTPFTLNASANVRYYATDLAGNASAVASQLVRIDQTPPVNLISISSANGAYLRSGTVYYRGTAGSFTLTNYLSDTGAGVFSSATSALGGTSTGFSHTPSTVSTPAAGPYVSNVFSWTNGTTSSPTVTVTGTDVAGNTAATVLAFANDITAPSGGSVDATGLVGTGSRYSTSTSLSVAFNRGVDFGAGPAPSGLLLQRATATLTSGVCGTYGAPATIATDPVTSPYADTVTDQACYRYTYVVPDLLGNTATFTSGDVKVDTTVPATPTFSYVAGTNSYVNGTTLYYRSTAGSGSFTATAASSDAASGIASYAFPALGTNWTSTPGATGVNTYSWTATAAAPASKTVAAANNAGLTASAVMNLNDDTTAPTGGSITYTGGYTAANPFSVAYTTGTDTGGSGISTTLGQLQRRSTNLPSVSPGTCNAAGWTAWATIATNPANPYPDTVNPSTCYQYQYLPADNVGNVGAAYTSANTVKIPAFTTCSAAVLGVPGTLPDEYYRFNESVGATTAADSSGNARNGTYNPGTTTGQLGACNNGVLLNGTTGWVSTPASGLFNNPQVLSEEIWFRTTTTTGGKLIGFGDVRTGSVSNRYDRHIWMSTDGKLNFGTTTPTGVLGANVQNNIVSPLAYNDDKWHHAAATLSAGGLRLYVDGVSVANDPAITAAEVTNGYFRIGWDSLVGWFPLIGPTATNYFSGQLSNAAVYVNKTLTAPQVWDHYIAGTLTSPNTTLVPLASVQSSGFSARRVPAPPASPSPSPSASPSLSPAPSLSPSPSLTPSPSPSLSPSPLPAPSPSSLSPLPSLLPSGSSAPTASTNSFAPSLVPSLPTFLLWWGRG